MAYTPDPTDSSQPVSGVKASTAAAEFRALKQYIAALAGLTPITSISALTVQQLNGGQLAGLRNRVINGGCQVTQRTTPTLSSTPQYGVVDRYLMSVSGTGVSGTIQQVSAGEFTASGLGIGTVGSWTSGAPQIEQRIEAHNTYDLNNKTVTISGKVYHSLGSTRNCRVQLNRPTTTADTFSAQTVIGTSSTFSCPDATATSFSFTLTLGASDATFGLAIQVYDSANSTVASKIFALSELQLEIGSVPTAFEQRPFGLELALCQRYYYRMAATLGGARIFGAGTALTTSIPQFYTQFPVEMRVIPTAFENSGNAADYEVYWGSGPTACTGAPTNYSTGTWGASYRFATGATLVNNAAIFAQAKTTSSFLAWSAEL